MSNDDNPAITQSVIAGIVGTGVLIAVTRANRSVDIFDAIELEMFKTWLPLVATFVAGVLIRRKVTPVAKAEARAKTVEAMVYAQALEDQPGDSEPRRRRPLHADRPPDP